MDLEHIGIIAGGAVLVILLILLAVRLVFAGCFRCTKSTTSGIDTVGQEFMKACVHDKHGGPEVLKIKHEPIPDFATDEVLIRVYAVSLNPVDYKFLQGLISKIEWLVGIPSHCIPGFDVSGEVVAVGSACNGRFQPGDEVFGMAEFCVRGTIAEYVSMKAVRLARKPKSLSHEEAASLPLVAQTSYQAMLEFGELKKHSKILILGGAGGTGTAAIQMAKHFGAYVATTASSRNIDLVKSLGADEIINYREEEWEDILAGQNYDIIYACASDGTASTKAPRVLKPRGHFVSINGDADHPCTVVSKTVSSKCGCGHKYNIFTCFGSGPRQDIIAQLVEDGALKAVVDKVYPLKNAKEAFAYSISGKAQGKIVISLHPGSGAGASAEDEKKSV